MCARVLHYATAYRGGNAVAGFSDMLQPGQPVQWTGYLLVEDAAATCTRARELGATILFDAMPVEDLGTMAIMAAPGGEVFGLWQAGRHHGAELANIEGALTWIELRTREPEQTARFYEQLLGWTCTKQSFPGLDYWTFALDGRPHAGMHLLSEEMGDVPPHWGITNGVEHTDTAVEWVTAQGGTITYGPMDSPFGRIAGIADPFGAVLNILQPPPGGFQQP